MTGDGLEMGNGSDIKEGYLYKKTKENKWQKRYFETYGEYLTYFKSKKKEKILAALFLPQVGMIQRISADKETGVGSEGANNEGYFALELNTRIYTLRAKTDVEADMWVKKLTNIQLEGQKQLANSTSNPLNLKIAVDNIDGSSIERTNKLPEADFIKATKCCCLF